MVILSCLLPKVGKNWKKYILSDRHNKLPQFCDHFLYVISLAYRVRKWEKHDENYVNIHHDCECGNIWELSHHMNGVSNGCWMLKVVLLCNFEAIQFFSIQESKQWCRTTILSKNATHTLGWETNINHLLHY